MDTSISVDTRRFDRLSARPQQQTASMQKKRRIYLSHRLLPFLSLLVTTKSKPLSQARRQCQHTSPTPRVAGDPDGQRGLKSEKRPATPAHTTLRRLITGALSRRTQSRKHQNKRKGSLGRATSHYPTTQPDVTIVLPPEVAVVSRGARVKYFRLISTLEPYYAAKTSLQWPQQQRSTKTFFSFSFSFLFYFFPLFSLLVLKMSSRTD